MPATTKLTMAALLATTTLLAGCNSAKHPNASSSTSAGDAAGALATAAVGAAGDASAPAGGSDTSAGCLLTGAQATAAMGATYADPTSAYGICSYLGSNNAFTIAVNDASGIWTYDATLATAQQDQMTEHSTPTPIAGLGDKAAGTGLEIVVQSHGKSIDIRNADQTPGGGWPKSVALAKLVIAALH